MYIPTEMISGIHHVGCTYLRKWFLGFTVWDVHTYKNDWVPMPRPIAHGPSLGPRRAYPQQFLGRVGRTPLRPYSLGDGSKCRRRKGLKTICIAPTRTRITPKDCSKWSTSTLSIHIFTIYMKSSSTKPKVSSSLLGGMSHLGELYSKNWAKATLMMWI